MTWIHAKIQNGWMERWGFRGRWLTAYLHRYGGVAESTERFHRHPWWLSFGVLLSGHLCEEVGREGIWCGQKGCCCVKRRRRAAPSFELYWREDQHRIHAGRGWSVFVGLGRSREKLDPGATCRVTEGWCHYTELNVNEEGIKG